MIKNIHHLFVASLFVVVMYFALKMYYSKPPPDLPPKKEELPKLEVDKKLALAITKRICSFIGLGPICQTLAMRRRVELIMERNCNYSNYVVISNFSYQHRENRFMLSHLIEDVFYIKLTIRITNAPKPIKLILNNRKFTFEKTDFPELDSCW